MHICLTWCTVVNLRDERLVVQYEVDGAPTGAAAPGLVPVATIAIGAAVAAVAVALPALPAVALVKVGGVVTVATLGMLRREVLRRYASQVKVYVVDYREAVLAMAPADLDAAAERAPIDMPGAIVTPSEHLGTFCAHARRAAQLGQVRRVFTEAEPALAWAVRQASLD